MIRNQLIIAALLILSFEGLAQKTVFELLDPVKTGVTFSNPVKDTREVNILIYEGLYDGAGVAIGDLNNDGLQDIYFAGNLVKDELYLNKGNLRFEEITEEAGILNRGGWSTGVSIIDINQDGWMDIYVCKSLYDESPALRSNELYINQGPDGNGIPRFTESAFQYGLNDFWRSMQATFLDYDRDGDPDLFLVNQPPNPGMLSPLAGQDWLDTLYSCRLLENQGSKFVDVTTRAGVRERGYALSAISGDFNHDGWTDLYVCNDYDIPDFLYLNRKDGTFENAINQSMAHISYFSMGSDVGDINNDGWMDIVALDMVAEDNYRLKANMGGMEPEKFWNIVNAGGHYQYMFNTLQLNRGTDANGKVWFSDIAQFAGIANTDWSWTPLLADFDNDGHKDLFVTNGIKKDLRNTDAIRNTEAYLKQKIDAFVSENPNAGDINIWQVIEMNDILDLLPSEKLANYIFRNTGKYSFEKKTAEWGLDQKTFSSGAAYGDLDNDGDLDLVINNVDDPAFIYENKTNAHTKNNYIKILLTDQDKHRSTIGTRIRIQTPSGNQYAEVATARGFYSDSEDVIHFGLGKDQRVELIEVIWPSGEISRLKSVKANQQITADWSQHTGKDTPKPENPLFEDITQASGLNFTHKENYFDDFEREVLIPHRMSSLGPALACGDVNGDGKEDVFIGGASGQAGKLFLQQENGTFLPSGYSPWSQDQQSEDLGAAFFDIDNDGDLDLYVVSGGNEFPVGSPVYQDRIYLNAGEGKFEKHTSMLPVITASGSCVLPEDMDGDGDIDLFIGGRQVPGQWPSPAHSYILKNNMSESGEPEWVDVTESVAPELRKLGMVTDGDWVDFDGDGDKDLVVSGVWMPVTFFENQNGKLVNITSKLGSNIKDASGWWFSLKAADIDQDGDQDFIAGNLGLNYKYKASEDAPFSVHYDDFDENGSHDIVLSYYNFGEQFPVRGRSCSSQQIPDLKEQFPNYHSFASSTLSEVYGEFSLKQALHYEATTFASCWIENKGNNKFAIHELPAEAQFSSINDIIIRDFNQDGYPDLVIAGNLFHAEVETTRNDASVGLFMKGNKDGKFTPVPMDQSGLNLPYDVKQLEFISIDGIPSIIAAVNNGPTRVIRLTR